MAKNIILFMLLALIFALALPGCTTPGPKAGKQGDGSYVVVISADKMRACTAEGGCGLFSAARLAEMQQEAFENGAEAGAAASCKKNKVLL